MGNYNVSSLNDLFKQTYGDKIKEMFTEEKWVLGTKIARKVYHDQIQDEKDGMIRINDVPFKSGLLDRVKK